jgi:hypothetical protein
MVDAEPSQRAPFPDRGIADDIGLRQHADLIDGERAHAVGKRHGQKRAHLRKPEGNAHIPALARRPVLGQIQQPPEGDDIGPAELVDGARLRAALQR